VERFRPGAGSPGDYFLVVGELVRHKRIEVALEAASAAQARVRVVGSGPDLERLRARYGQADFLGRVNDQDLAALYAGALALVVPNVEEFGIAAVEAQAAGRPVLGVDGGGLRETVIQGATGVLVDETDGARGLAEAMRKVDFAAFDPAEAARNAQRFSASRFRSSLVELVKAAAQC
jgi:glycosyltransferase involved in cell wall biosynthesis